MSSNTDCGSTMDSFEISMKLSDSIYNEEESRFREDEDVIPDYVFPQESENNFDEIISSGGGLYNGQDYYESNYVVDVNMACLDSDLNQGGESKVSSKKRRSSLSSNASEGTFKHRHGLTPETDIPGEVTLGGDNGITYRYIADFSIYNNKLSRMMPLDCLPNKFESIYFVGEEGTLDSFVNVADSETSIGAKGVAERKPQEDQSCGELTLIGTLIPYEYILGYEKERTVILKDNFRKLQRVRQKGVGSYKPRKTKEMPRSILKQGGLKTFQVTCRIHSWTIEFGANLFDTPYIWACSVSGDGCSKVCYRLCWPASKYSKLFSSAKVKFEVISRLIKTLLSPSSNRMGYKTFLDQITGKLADKPAKPVLKNPEEEQAPEQTPEAASEPASETSSPSKKASKGVVSVEDSQQTTVWGEPMGVVGLSEREVLLMLPFIEYYLQTYSKKHNLSKTLGLQIVTSMKNKLTKMILSEDSTLDENYISSNITGLLQNSDLVEKIFDSGKQKTSSGVGAAGGVNSKKRRSSVSKNEDSLKLVLPRFKDFMESFASCQRILRISDFCNSFGDILELPVHSASLLSLQSFHSRGFSLEKSKCVSSEIMDQVYLEYNKVVARLKDERDSGLVSQEGLCGLIKIMRSFPQSTLFSTLRSLVNAISERVLVSKKAGSEDSGQAGGKTAPGVKRSYYSFRNESEQSDSESDAKSGDEPGLKFLEALNVSREVIDSVSWPVALEKILAKMSESDRSGLGDYLDETGFEDYSSGEQRLLTEEEQQQEGTGAEMAGIASARSPPGLSRRHDRSDLCALSNDSFLEVLNWSVATLGEGKIGREFIEHAYNSQKKKNSMGRNDGLIGVDRFSNKYFLFRNITTQSTLSKSVVIVPSCMDGFNNAAIAHPVPCANPLCTVSRETGSPCGLVSSPEIAEMKNFLRMKSTQKDERSSPSAPSYKIVSKKKDIESLMNSLCGDHFCEFQLKLKLKSTFNCREFEHEPFNPERYVQECISQGRPVFLPFNMSLPRMDLEKQFFYLSVLNIIKEVSVVYLKAVFPMVVCVMNQIQTHFSILDQILGLSTQVFDRFAKEVDVTYYSSQEVLGRTAQLIKAVCEAAMGSVGSFGIQVDKRTSQTHSQWMRELEALGGIDHPPEGEARISLGEAISSSHNKRLSVIAVYLKQWVRSIVPSDLIAISTGGSGWWPGPGQDDPAASFGRGGFIYDREEFVSAVGDSSEKRLKSLETLVPRQLDQLYYFKSGHLLVNLSWMNSVLTKNRKANGAILRLIEKFTDIPAHMASVEKIKVVSVCYNSGSRGDGPTDAGSGGSSPGEGEAAAVVPPFILIGCQVATRQNPHCADDAVEMVDRLKRSFEQIQQLSIEHFSRKRTSNRIKNNNLSNSYRDAMIADSTFTITEPRDTFIKKNLSYDQESQNETRYISIILPLSLSGQNHGLPAGRLSHLQRRSFEIFSFKPTTPFYIVSEQVFRASVKDMAERCSFKISYSLGERSYGGFIRRIIIEDYDVWDCIVVENEESKKNKDNVLVCLNLWQVLPD